MQIFPRTLKFSAATLLCGILFASALPGQTAGGTAQGLALYKQRKFAEAAKVLEGVAQNPAADANSLYYYALSLHQMGNYDKAKRAYQRISQQYPNSPAGGLARQALAAFGTPGHVSNSGGGGGGGSFTTASYGGGAVDESLPEQAKVYFTPSASTQMIVDAYVNNRPIKMLFDTGADMCAFGKNHLRDLGMPIPTGKPTSQSMGVGDGGLQDNWDVPATVRVGTIERKNMHISVQNNLQGEPLLGQTFFKDFTYTIDKGSNSILFTRKRRAVVASSRGSSGGGSGGVDRNTIPFVRLGNSISVTGYVNGKPQAMIFDTGADGTVFAPGDMKRLGIAIPEDAEEERHAGIAGDTRGVGFEIQRMTLGPIDRSNFKISVVQGMEAGHPLIGRSFLGEWQYTIDNDARVIHFLRR